MAPTPSREFYRIVYPMRERPRLVLGTDMHEVIDCSEKGIRFRLSRPLPLAPPDEVDGRLILRSGSEVPVRGIVKRRDGDTVAAYLNEQGIPLAAVLKEQIYLRRRGYLLAE